MLDVYAFIDYKRGIYPHPYLKSSSHLFFVRYYFFHNKRNRSPIISD